MGAQDEPCNAKGASPARRGPCRMVSFTSRGRAATQRGGGMGSSRPRPPNPTTSTGPNAGSLPATPHGPCQPLAAPTLSTPAVPGHSAAAGQGPWARSSLQLSRGALNHSRAKRGEERQERQGRRRSRRPGKHLYSLGKRLLSWKRRNSFPAKETPQGCPSVKCRPSPAHRFSRLQSIRHPPHPARCPGAELRCTP